MQAQDDIENSSKPSEKEHNVAQQTGAADPELLRIKAIMAVDAEVSGAPTTAHRSDTRASGQASENAALGKSGSNSSLAHQVQARVAVFLRRPDAPRLLAMALLLTVLIFDPGFMLFLFILSVLTAVVLYFSFGAERVETWVAHRYWQLRERDPVAAEKIRRRAARTSAFLSKLIAKLPESWTSGLYLPEFEEPTELHENLKSDPFDRLANH